MRFYKLERDLNIIKVYSRSFFNEKRCNVKIKFLKSKHQRARDLVEKMIMNIE